MIFATRCCGAPNRRQQPVAELLRATVCNIVLRPLSGLSPVRKGEEKEGIGEKDVCCGRVADERKNEKILKNLDTLGAFSPGVSHPLRKTFLEWSKQ